MTKSRLLNLTAEEQEETETPVNFSINQKYAEKYLEKKKKEELSKLEDRYKEKLKSKGVKNILTDDESETETDSESDVVEDEDGELITPAIEVQILKTIADIRTKSDNVYNPNVKFFSEEGLKEAEKEWNKNNSSKQAKPLRLKDYQREKLLKTKGLDVSEEDSDDGEEDSKDNTKKVKTHEEEQTELLDAFKEAAAVLDGDNDEGDESFGDDDRLLKVRPKSEHELAKEDEEYKNFLLENLASNENTKESMHEWFNSRGSGKAITNDEQFLVDYILNRGWMDKDKRSIPSYDQIVKDEEEDEEAVEKMEEFEEKYNFRYEQPGGDQIVTYSRNIEGSLRRPDNKRKEERASRKTKKLEEKERQKEELKRLKNLKRQEIQQKLNKIKLISGNENIDGELDLESDFDPSEHDRKMRKLFNDEYYGDDDEKKPVFTDSELDEEEEITKTQTKVIKKATKSIAKLADKTSLDTKRTLSDYLDEYYQLDYEDMIGGDLPCRFKYQTVKPTTFGLKVNDILMADDSDLNQHVSLRKLAPYRSAPVLEADELKYGNKKKLYKFYDLLNNNTGQPSPGSNNSKKNKKSRTR